MQIRRPLSGSTVEDDLASQSIFSRTKLRILDLLSRRPRTLRELSNLTGISIQGVVRHLESLKKLGIIGERRITSKELPARKIYFLARVRINDFSVGNLTVVRSAKTRRATTSKLGAEELEDLASELLVRRRQIRERVNRLARMIDQFTDDEVRLVGSIEAMDLSDEERLILETAFTEDTLQEAENILSKSQGMPNASKSMNKAMAKARSLAKK